MTSDTINDTVLQRHGVTRDEYDRIAAADKRVAMILRPDHVYGTALARMRQALAK